MYKILIEESVYTAGEPFFLLGGVLDLEDGIVPDENIRWVSDVDGELGFGQSLQVELSLGTHNISL